MWTCPESDESNLYPPILFLWGLLQYYFPTHAPHCAIFFTFLLIQLGPKCLPQVLAVIHPSAIFSYHTLSEQVLHPCKTKDKIILSCNLILKSWDRKWSMGQGNGRKHSINLIHLIFMCIQFWFVSVALKYVNFSIYGKDLQADFNVVILSCILLMRNEHTFSFLWIYFHTNFIISD